MLQFETALIEQVTDAVEQVFTTGYPDILLQDPYIGPDLPLTRERFPAIILTYTARKTQNLGMGHLIEIINDQTGIPSIVCQWRFEGAMRFEVVTLTSLDRVTLLDELVSMLGFGRFVPVYAPFWNQLVDEAFIDMTLLTQSLNTEGHTEEEVPWGDTDAKLYKSAVTCDVVGEFLSDTVSSDLIRVAGINILPYRPDQTPPPTSNEFPWQ